MTDSNSNHAGIASRALLAGAFLLSMAVLVIAWGVPFYFESRLVGHDFAGSAPQLIEGKYWIDVNGLLFGLLNPPWFSPAWCAGAAFYADPQSIYYAPVQWFALITDPISATFWAMMLFAAVAYWSSYALATRVMYWSSASSTYFAVLGAANAFVPLRSAVGESGYQPLYLWPLLAIALCWRSSDSTKRLYWPMLAVCLVLTAWLQFGFGGMIVPAFLATLLFSLVLVLLDKANLRDIIVRAAAGGVLAIILNASKLYESASLMRHFPRSYYDLPGFASLSDAALATVYGLLQPSQWTTQFASPRLQNVSFAVLPHEWAMHFGLGAAVVALMLALYCFFKRDQTTQPTTNLRSLSAEKRVALVLVAFLVLLPVLLLWNDAGVRSLLKQIPILNSAAWPMRWVVVLLPVTQLLLAVPLAMVLRNQRTPAMHATLAVAILVSLAGPALEPVGYYVDRRIQNYDSTASVATFAASLRAPPVAIASIAAPSMERGLPISRNDTMFQGASQAYCYNPIYGYRLEKFPQIDRIRAGPALAVDASGRSILLNPACLVHPEANDCRPGDGFRLNEPGTAAQASEFLARRPFEWQRPPLGNALSLLSQVAWATAAAWLIFCAVRLIRNTVARKRSSMDHRD